jgi:cytochrome c5
VYDNGGLLLRRLEQKRSQNEQAQGLPKGVDGCDACHEADKTTIPKPHDREGNECADNDRYENKANEGNQSGDNGSD